MKTDLTNSTQAASDGEHLVVQKSIARKIFKGLATAFAVWIFVFTMMWTYLTDYAIHQMYEIATSMDSDPPDFRVYVKQSKVLKGLCDASNWVADKTRPIVSDEVLVALWEAKHVQWEELIRNAKPGETNLEKINPELAKSSGLSNIYKFVDIEVNTKNPLPVHILDSYGRSRSLRACHGKGGYVEKYIEYYSNIAPVVYEGRVMPPSTLKFYEKKYGKPPWPNVPGIKLVTNTDLESNEYAVTRKLTDRWFIFHQTLDD